MIDKIILGTVQMGLPYGIQNGGNLSYSDSEKILKSAYKNGIDQLDTAEVYGNSHAVIGAFHKNNPSQRFKIVTKFPKNFSGEAEKKINEYLIELHIDQLETIMFHAFRDLKTNKKSLLELNHLRQKDIIRTIGVSVYTNEEFKEAMNFDAIDIIQLPYNLLDNFGNRGQLFGQARDKGKIIHTRSAFLQGLFFMDINSNNVVVKELYPELSKIRKIANKEGMSISSLALNYCLQENLIDKVLIGVDSVYQLNENLKIIGNKISSKSVLNLNNIYVQNQNLLNPSLW